MNTYDAAAESIINTTIKLIEDSGGDIRNITARAISAGSGVSLGLINYHFGSKDNLITICCNRMISMTLAGLAPDFADADLDAESVPFAVDLGHAGHGTRTLRIPSGAARIVAERGCAEAVSAEDAAAAVRFLGLFLRYHLDIPPDIRRNTLQMLGC